MKKNVSNLMLNICSILDILEQPELDKKKFALSAMKIDKLFYDVDRQIRKKIKDEFHQLDFKALDLVALSDAAKKHLNKIQARMQYASMKKYLLSRSPIQAGDFELWQKDIVLTASVVTVLTRINSVFSYQAILVSILEGEDEMYKLENVFLSTIQEELRKSKVDISFE